MSVYSIILFLAFALILGSFFSALIENEVVGYQESSTISSLSTYEVIHSEGSGSLDIPTSPTGMWGKFTQILTWDFAFFDGGYSWIRYMMLAPLTITMSIAVILMFVNSVFGIFSR